MSDIKIVTLACIYMFAAGYHQKAYAEDGSCSLSGFNSGPPSAQTDSSPETSQSSFDWGADVDAFNKIWRSWHFIRNNHDLKLSVNWRKADLLIAFDKPLPTRGINCVLKYAGTNDFKLDTDAPITVSGDTDKAAVVFVADAKGSSVTGAEVRTQYETKNGERKTGFMSLIIEYFKADRLMSLNIATMSEGTRIVLNPGDLSLTEEQLVTKVQQQGGKATVVPSLAEFGGNDEFAKAFLETNSNDNFVAVQLNGEQKFSFSDVSAPAGVSPIVLLDSDGSMIAATHINLDILK